MLLTKKNASIVRIFYEFLRCFLYNGRCFFGKLPHHIEFEYFRMKAIVLTGLLSLLMCFGSSIVLAQQEFSDPNPLPKELTAEEMLRLDEIGINFQPTPPPSGSIRNIAEFERNEAVLIRYSTPFAWPLNLIATLSEHVNVVTLVSNRDQQSQAYNAFLNAGVDMDRVEFIRAATNSVWTRDYGPFYIVNENNQVSVVDFKYNRPRPLDDAIPAQLATRLGMPFYGMNIVHTGGNYMTDGYGISASTDLIWEENGFNQNNVLENMSNFLNTETYHVTIDPQNSSIKHIDTWAKFLDVDKIMIARVPPNHPRYQQHEQVATYFANQTSAWGTPFQVFRVDTPNGQPYTNSLIVNERVYVPLMNSTWDAAAIAAYQQALPGYEILGFTGNPQFNWNSSDALHCRVKEIPDRGMLSLLHTPFAGHFDYVPEKEFTIEINPLSGQPVIADSLFLIYRFNEAPFDTLTLSHVSDNTYHAFMPVLASGGSVDYYFYATDASGRQEHFPLIGKVGARTFTIEGTTVNTESDVLPLAFTLEQNYPNPFNPATNIRYTIHEAGYVYLSVYTITGQKLETLVSKTQQPGNYSAIFSAERYASGVFIYRLEHISDQGSRVVQSNKMVLVK